MPNSRVWEMGSEFHLLTDFPDTSSHHLPYSGTLFVNGRAALRHIIDGLNIATNTCWIPSYVCSEVYNVLAPVVNVQVYGDYPGDDSPQFETLAARSGDIVLIQDTFGLGDTSQWHAWKQHNPEVILIEDISHSSTQERFHTSPAHHVFSSIRKSLPIADGGIVFSRDGGLQQSSAHVNPGSQLKLEAMILKSMYLAGHPVEKQAFRDLQIAGEEALNQVEKGNCLSHSVQMLQALPHTAMRSRWQRNNERLSKNLLTAGISGTVQVLQPRGTDKGLFHTVLKCCDEKRRDHLREHLIANRVFSTVHWPQNHSRADDRARQLGEILLTVPTDFRYSKNDIDVLVELIVEGAKPN